MIYPLIVCFAAFIPHLLQAAEVSAGVGGKQAQLLPSATVHETPQQAGSTNIFPSSAVVAELRRISMSVGKVADKMLQTAQPLTRFAAPPSHVASVSVASEENRTPMSDASEENADWETRFTLGLQRSELLTQADERTAGPWVSDYNGSGAGVPQRMLHVEELLREAADSAPAAQLKEKTAQRALCVYHHAKWLAERNYASAAEWRYREASRLARQSKRSVLAAHSLSRLGYFLMYWFRYKEAKEVLHTSLQLNSKANPVAHYLFGVLERREAGPDTERLRAAEERIIHAGEQASEELDTQRYELLQEINYWHEAEHSLRQCFQTFDAAHVLICVGSHLFMALKRAVIA